MKQSKSRKRCPICWLRIRGPHHDEGSHHKTRVAKLKGGK